MRYCSACSSGWEKSKSEVSSHHQVVPLFSVLGAELAQGRCWGEFPDLCVASVHYEDAQGHSRAKREMRDEITSALVQKQQVKYLQSTHTHCSQVIYWQHSTNSLLDDALRMFCPQIFRHNTFNASWPSSMPYILFLIPFRASQHNLRNGMNNEA